MKRLLIVLSLLVTGIAQASHPAEPSKYSQPELESVIHRLVSGAGQAAPDAGAPIVGQQSKPCAKVGGTPKAPVCAGTCSNGGLCDIAFTKGGSSYCSC